MSNWGHVSSRLGNVKPETLATAQEVYEAARAAGHDIWFMWGMGDGAEHGSGLAIDWMVRTEAAGDFVRDYLWTHRARLRLRHVIWEQHITSTVVQPGARRKMNDRGNPTANHFDHVHSWQFAGAYRPVEGTPNVDPNVKLDVDGRLGPKTIAKWQKVMGTTVDGKIDERDSQLVRAVQQRLKATVARDLVVDGEGIRQDGRRYRTVAALQKYLGTPGDGYMSVPVSQVVKAVQRRLNENRF